MPFLYDKEKHELWSKVVEYLNKVINSKKKYFFLKFLSSKIWMRSGIAG